MKCHSTGAAHNPATPTASMTHTLMPASRIVSPPAAMTSNAVPRSGCFKISKEHVLSHQTACRHYLRRRYGLSYTRATASVVMDKLFELLGNFVLLSFGLVAILHSGLLGDLSGTSRLLLFGLVALVTWPLIHISLLYRRVYPVSAFLRILGPRVTRRKAMRFARACEHLAGQFCQRHPRAMLAGLGVSLLAAAATVSEYALTTSFLSISLPFWKLITAWTSGWLAFLVPLPGAVGALEACQVSVLSLFGISAAAAISVTLLMRGRDLLIGGLGLLLAGHSARRS